MTFTASEFQSSLADPFFYHPLRKPLMRPIIATIYNGLEKRDETMVWLERGFQQREPRMVFLTIESKWNNLHDDPRFQDLLRPIGFYSMKNAPRMSGSPHPRVAAAQLLRS